MLPDITYEICVDWDATNWAEEPDFSEAYDKISGDVAADGVDFVGWMRGKEREEGNAPAATLQVRMVAGLCQKYSPYTTGVLAGKIRPWLPIRVRAYHDGTWYPCFFGFIDKISINPHPDIQSVILYCTDGIDLLARQKVTQDPTNKTICSDGDATEKILDAAGWPTARRKIDKSGGDDLLGYPNTHPY